MGTFPLSKLKNDYISEKFFTFNVSMKVKTQKRLRHLKISVVPFTAKSCLPIHI